MAKENILKDWKHWLGWVLTTFAIIIYSHFLGIHIFHTEKYIPSFSGLGLMVVVIIIDVIKHKTKLQ